MYVHLTTHSAFSLQEGLSTPTELVKAAQANGMPALGLTDHNLLTGVIEFVTACKAVDIQPIIGLEIDLNDGPVSLFAAGLEAWSYLCRLSSSINLRDNPSAPFCQKMQRRHPMLLSLLPSRYRNGFSNTRKRLQRQMKLPNAASLIYPLVVHRCRRFLCRMGLRLHNICGTKP